MSIQTTPVRISIGGEHVSGLLLAPAGCRACYVLAHGAGAGMSHRFMETVASGLSERGIATFRYQFLYMEQKSKRPDPPKVAHSVVRAAVTRAGELLPGVPLFAGGKSFGGRMTSQAQAIAALPAVKGLIFLGFPLHPAGKPSIDRAAHLKEVRIPMLFLQGTRDELATLPLIQEVCHDLGPSTKVKLFDQADHSFHVPARSGRTDAQVMSDLLDAIRTWIDQQL